jgi:phosphatidylserine/phosphatidylglycerophosphate/cardiolipin synthase-like enzyme
MRKSKTTNEFKVNAIAGTYVVILAFDLPENKCEGLLGFSIHRFDHNENEAYYLEGMKAFAETDPGFPSGSLYSTKDHPIQSFQWADYSAKPGYTYTYTVTALKGSPTNLISIAQTEIEITTELVDAVNHDIYFNRGTAASQEYVRRFGDRPPDEVPNNKAFVWLSRGIYEALEKYIKSCIPGKHSLRIAAYEFNYEPFLRLLKATINKGVDIQIVYDARKASPKDKNEEMVSLCGLNDYCTPRTEGASYISHNKFIVKLEKDDPIVVWTGGMNFSEGGIFGHSNVAHVIKEPNVARKYLEYWNNLNGNPKSTPLKNKVEELTPLPAIPVQTGSTCVFSPRKTLDALTLYSDLAMSAKHGLFMTFAFGINKIFKDVYRNSTAPLRFALLEKATRPMKDGPQKDAELQDIQNLRNFNENIFAIGDFIQTNKFDGWVKESLSGLNNNVKYVHNKFMLVDPLSNNPIIITGSANFSDASTTDNDENMVIIIDNTRVADIYLGEFMRLFSHHSFRESLKWRKPNEPPKPLRTDNWWSDNFGNTDRSNRRKFFSQTL